MMAPTRLLKKTTKETKEYVGFTPSGRGVKVTAGRVDEMFGSKGEGESRGSLVNKAESIEVLWDQSDDPNLANLPVHDHQLTCHPPPRLLQYLNRP